MFTYLQKQVLATENCHRSSLPQQALRRQLSHIPSLKYTAVSAQLNDRAKLYSASW